MSEYRKTSPDDLYFVTLTITGWIDLFSRKDWLLHQFQFAAKINKQYSHYHLWQYTNHPTLLFSWEAIKQKEKYIHDNPVRAGLVTDAGAYLYSSACVESPLKISEW
jgi:putative transposase